MALRKMINQVFSKLPLLENIQFKELIRALKAFMGAFPGINRLEHIFIAGSSVKPRINNKSSPPGV